MERPISLIYPLECDVNITESMIVVEPDRIRRNAAGGRRNQTKIQRMINSLRL